MIYPRKPSEIKSTSTPDLVKFHQSKGATTTLVSLDEIAQLIVVLMPVFNCVVLHCNDNVPSCIYKGDG